MTPFKCFPSTVGSHSILVGNLCLYLPKPEFEDLGITGPGFRQVHRSLQSSSAPPCLLQVNLVVFQGQEDLLCESFCFQRVEFYVVQCNRHSLKTSLKLLRAVKSDALKSLFVAFSAKSEAQGLATVFLLVIGDITLSKDRGKNTTPSLL